VLYFLFALPLLNSRDTTSSDFLLVFPGGTRYGMYGAWGVSSKEEIGDHLQGTVFLQAFLYFSPFVYV